MKEGRIFAETLKLNSVARHQNLVEPGMANAICGSDPQSPWLAKEFAPSPTPSHHESERVHIRERRISTDKMDDARRENSPKSLSLQGTSAVKAIPTLRKKTLKVSARVPRVLPVKLAPEPTKGGDHGIELPVTVQEPCLPAVELVPKTILAEPEPKESVAIEPSMLKLPPEEIVPSDLPYMDIPAHVHVKVIPTPKKRAPRALASEDERTTPPVTKPLKVIRKRREQEPKIFETAPKPVPQAMLEGIKTSKENGDETE